MYGYGLYSTAASFFGFIGILTFILFASFLYAYVKQKSLKKCPDCKGKNIKISKRNYTIWKDINYETKYTCEDCGNERVTIKNVKLS